MERMSEDKKDPWLNYLALTTVILAVCATLSSFRGSSYSTQRILNQTQASDQWAFYQAKSIKGYIYQASKDGLELELAALGAKVPQQVTEAYQGKIADYATQIARYEAERKGIQEKAQDHERIRDDAARHGQAFNFAVIFLQIAILLSSIAALMKKKAIWLLGSLVGLVGVLYFVNGFFVFL
jgi:hypothetical protein